MTLKIFYPIHEFFKVWGVIKLLQLSLVGKSWQKTLHHIGLAGLEQYIVFIF